MTQNRGVRKHVFFRLQLFLLFHWSFSTRICPREGTLAGVIDLRGFFDGNRVVGQVIPPTVRAMNELTFRRKTKATTVVWAFWNTLTPKISWTKRAAFGCSRSRCDASRVYFDGAITYSRSRCVPFTYRDYHKYLCPLFLLTEKNWGQGIGQEFLFSGTLYIFHFPN